MAAGRAAGTPRAVLFVACATLLAALLLVQMVLTARQRPDRGQAAYQAAVTRGRFDFSTGSCISCHTLVPISYAGAAIDLTHEGRRRSLAWLRHEIRFPTSARPPTPPGQADDLAIFLSSLK